MIDDLGRAEHGESEVGKKKKPRVGLDLRAWREAQVTRKEAYNIALKND